MPDGSIECVLGQLQVQMTHVLEQLRKSAEEAEVFREEMRLAVKDLDVRMREVEHVIVSAKSSWKTVVWLGSTAGLFIAAMWTLFQMFHETFGKVWKVFSGA